MLGQGRVGATLFFHISYHEPWSDKIGQGLHTLGKLMRERNILDRYQKKNSHTEIRTV